MVGVERLVSSQVSPLLSQMGRMFGGSDALNPELLSGKLEEMLPVIRQVKRVGSQSRNHSYGRRFNPTGERAIQGPGRDDLRVRVHRRVPLALRDGAADTRVDQVRHRHA